MTERKFITDSGIEIKPLYEASDSQNPLGKPGEYPYTRGVHAEMYRKRLWTMRQYAGFSSAAESNKRYRYLLSQGVTGLSVAFDLPTQIGYDPTHSLSEGEVGKVGVSVASLKDVEALFAGITLQHITTSMTINATAAIMLAFYVALAKQQHADLTKISGTIQNDILKEYAARGTYRYPPKASLRLIADVFEWCSTELPKWNTISISGYHIREAGANAVQEVAFTLANGMEYVRNALQRGLDVDRFAPQLSFFFGAHNNLFEEVAKFRAARRMWAKVMKETFGATDERSMMLRFHTQTCGSTLTAQQIDNNIIRTTVQALAAVCGGTQSLHVNGKDEALALPTESSATTALRVQQVLAYESGAAGTPDPFAGSYFVESLTNEIESKAWDYINRIEEMGGAAKAIEAEFYQTEIASAAYDYQKSIDAKEKIIVGVNDFQSSVKEPEPELLRISDEVRNEQIARLQSLKASRDNAVVEKCLERITQAASGTANLMPHLIAAAEAYATLGEMAGALEKVWGEYEG
ncbi:MAG: methylmalonyl-CoA mutase [Rhizobacter sp.]|nr:methylmalonyl-CoA mutase [Chlorobiales bacterium]